MFFAMTVCAKQVALVELVKDELEFFQSGATEREIFLRRVAMMEFQGANASVVATTLAT